MAIQEGQKLPEATGARDARRASRGGDHRRVCSAARRWCCSRCRARSRPTCSQAHLPGYVANADKIKAKGVDDIVCVSVNDAFVMDAWGKDKNAEHLVMAGDGNADFTKALGLEMDGSGFGLGTRSQRYAMVVDDGVVTKLAVEAGGAFEVSKAEAILEAL